MIKSIKWIINASKRRKFFHNLRDAFNPDKPKYNRLELEKGIGDMADWYVKQIKKDIVYKYKAVETGAMAASVRRGRVRKSKNKVAVTISVGGVRRPTSNILTGEPTGSKFVDYAIHVHEGHGRHKGNPRRFLTDAMKNKSYNKKALETAFEKRTIRNQ